MGNKRYRLVAKDYRSNRIPLPGPMLYFNGLSYDEVRHVAWGVALGLRVNYKKPRVEIWDADTDALIFIQQY